MDKALTTAEAAPGSLLSAIVGLARDPSFDVSKLAALAELQWKMERAQAERAFNEALVAAQAELPPIDKHGVIDLGGKGKIPFARWEDMDAVLRPVREKYGFTQTWTVTPNPAGGSVVTCTLRHAGGHSVEASIPLPADAGPGRNSLQAMGSMLSYGRRYTTEILFNVVRRDEDDDGVRGGTIYMLPPHLTELEELLKETKTEESRFLLAVAPGCHSLEEVEDKHFVKLKNALLTKRAKMEKGAP